MNTGDRIRQARKRKNLTQAQLGKLCGMADSAIRRYESNRGNPTIATLNKIANALGISAQYLLSGDLNCNISGFGNGICAYSAAYMQEIDFLLEDRDPDSYKIVFRGPGVVITVDNDSDATQAQIDDVIAIYGSGESSANHDDLISNLLFAFSQLNDEGQNKAVERVEELTEISKYQKNP